jgi:hypothetical protein
MYCESFEDEELQDYADEHGIKAVLAMAYIAGYNNATTDTAGYIKSHE